MLKSEMLMSAQVCKHAKKKTQATQVSTFKEQVMLYELCLTFLKHLKVKSLHQCYTLQGTINQAPAQSVKSQHITKEG